MTIKLRIVGNFFRCDVDLPSGGSVKDVLDAAQSQSVGTDSTFQYATQTINGMTSPSMFTATYANDFTSPISGKPYPAETYTLVEDLHARPVYTVLQYYIFDNEDKFLNRGKGPILYDQAEVEDGQSVIWRMLSICAPVKQGKYVAPPRLSRAMGLRS